MGCNIPRPRKRPPTPQISDQPYGSKTNEAIIKSFDQFHKVAHGYLTPPKSVRIDTCVSKPKQITRTNCPNCCATITGPICEYCGTRFPDLESHYRILRTTENQEIIIPIYVGGDQVDEVVKRNNKTQFRSGGF